MGSRKDLTGQRFGRLLCESYSHTDPRPKSYANWNCICDCGSKIIVRGRSLIIGNTKSCGCLRVDIRTKHSLSKHPLYRRYINMMHRCHNPSDSNYPNYGARGIIVCERWHKLENYIADMAPSYMEGLEIDRINNNGNYEPDNCRWVTCSGNMKNRRCKAQQHSDIDYVIYKGKENKWAFSYIFDTRERAESFAIKVKDLLNETN